MKRPSLADLAAKKPTQAAPVYREVDEEALKATRAKAGSQPDGRKGILVRVKPEGWKELRDLAAELTLKGEYQVSMQSLIVDAINDVLKANGRPPVA